MRMYQQYVQVEDQQQLVQKDHVEIDLGTGLGSTIVAIDNPAFSGDEQYPAAVPQEVFREHVEETTRGTLTYGEDGDLLVNVDEWKAHGYDSCLECRVLCCFRCCHCCYNRGLLHLVHVA